MKRSLFLVLVLSFMSSAVFAQGLNKVVFGPLEGDNAGVLAVHNGENILIEVWIRTDPFNPGPLTGVAHCVSSEDAIIDALNGVIFDPDYDYPCWANIVSPDWHYPDAPPGHTTQCASGVFDTFNPSCTPVDSDGEWDYYGSFLMACNTDVPTDVTYYPLDDGYFPYTNQGTAWTWQGGGVVPETEFCGLYFEPDTCIYIPGDVNRNGAPLELADVFAMISVYRGNAEPYYTCTCTEESPYLGFAATADPNGNCIPNELNDVMTEIGAYRGSGTASGCPDCPGSD